jgi:ribokinase
MKKIDFLAIGDVVLDEFIKLQEASVHCNISKENCEICMKFADKIPYEDCWVIPAVGNAANAAASAAKLGLNTAFVTNLGDDKNGQECIDALKEAKISTEFAKTHKGTKTNYHYVLWYEDDRTILIKHEHYPYAFPEDIGTPKWIYFSSIADAAYPYHEKLVDHLLKNPEIKLGFQPGKFEIKLGKEKLARVYARSDAFFCNKEEAEKILGLGESVDIKILLEGMRALGPKIVVITDGPRGGFVYEEDRMWQMPIYPDPKPPYERTGAGDAFSSTFASVLCMGLGIETALKWAPINAMGVVQEIGAQRGLLTQEKIKEYLAKAPADYKPKRIN